MQCSCSAGGMLHVNGLWGVTCWQAMCHSDTPRMLMPCHMLQRQVHPLVLAVIVEHKVLPLLCVEGQHLPLMCAIIPCKQPSRVRLTRAIPLPYPLFSGNLNSNGKVCIAMGNDPDKDLYSTSEQLNNAILEKKAMLAVGPTLPCHSFGRGAVRQAVSIVAQVALAESPHNAHWQAQQGAAHLLPDFHFAGKV